MNFDEGAEAKRLKALFSYKILDTDSSVCFDDIALLATNITNAPYSLISFIDDKRQWFKSEIGLNIQELPIDQAFCLELNQGNLRSGIVVNDTLENPVYAEHPLVLTNPNIRFITAIPLFSSNDYVIGSLIVLDYKPRELSLEQRVGLQTLAHQIMAQLELSKIHDEQREMMTQMAKLSDLGVYAATIAHEINTPLTVLNSQSSMLDFKIKDGTITIDGIKKFSDSIQRNVERISKIVKGLKTIGRDGSKDPLQKNSILSIMEDVENICSKRIKDKSIDIVFETKEDTEFDCVASQMTQILINLINNAADAIESYSDKWIKVEAVDLIDCVQFSVTDSGNGIPEDIRDKIFGHFFTTKEVGKGTGIGLTVSAEIVRKHNGTISCDSNCPNTKFVVRIPKN